MSIAAFLLTYAAFLGSVVPLLLRRAGWVTRSPWLGILLWQALVASWLIAVGRAGMAMIAEPATIWSVAGGIGVVAVLLRSGWLVGGDVLRARREQREHASGLRLAGRHRAEVGAYVVDHEAPAAYCLPAPDRAHRVVVTTAALRLLDADQLDAVLAHERAHLRGRHHLILTIVGGLFRAFPMIPLFAVARGELETLVEMAADDTAASRHGRRPLAGALLQLARGSQPARALGAGGPSAARRVSRLLAPTPPLGPAAQTAGAATAVGAVTFPVAAACVPVVVMICAAFGLLSG
jgi:Zn-dependent protease with chaperone function